MMDDLLIHSTKKAHKDICKELLNQLLYGIKISPKKCKLFRNDLQYMGNTVFIGKKRVCIKPLRSRLEAIGKLKLQATVKGCESSSIRTVKTNLYSQEKGQTFFLTEVQ